jgi:ElaB/YqjD/DUF883 family membrane-anchored ribosome-binding protein
MENLLDASMLTNLLSSQTTSFDMGAVTSMASKYALPNVSEVKEKVLTPAESLIKKQESKIDSDKVSDFKDNITSSINEHKKTISNTINDIKENIKIIINNISKGIDWIRKAINDKLNQLLTLLSNMIASMIYNLLSTKQKFIDKFAKDKGEKLKVEAENKLSEKLKLIQDKLNADKMKAISVASSAKTMVQGKIEAFLGA